jgi:ketosteroid isomerase-like protein
MNHPNRKIAEQAWEAVATSDVAALRELWAEDIVWHVTARNPWMGDHVGADAVLEYLAQVGEAGETYDSSLEDVLVSDDRALLVCQVSARRGGRRVDTWQCMLARIAGGKIAEVWTLPLEPNALAAFWNEARSEEDSRRAS